MSIVFGIINPIWVVGLFSLLVALNSNKKLGGVLMRSSKLYRNIGGTPMEGKITEIQIKMRKNAIGFQDPGLKEWLTPSSLHHFE